jgi:5'(3')-deoxyribonucleotidase
MTKTLYIDMDGVVADWNQGAAQIAGHALNNPTARYSPEDWNKIKNHQRMYRELPLMPEAEALMTLARDFRDRSGWNLLFLTAIPHDNDVHWAFWDKCIWAQRYFPDVAVHFGPYSYDKHLHCQPGDILVDDRPENISDWRQAGGHGVLVVGSDFTAVLAELRSLQ